MADFPRAGIGFKDITPLLADPVARAGVDALAEYARPLVDCVVAAEARGFLLGPALALELGAGFVLARKPGKLPYETVSAEYLLEYGAGQLELHTDAVQPASGCSCTTICSPPAAPRGRCASLVEELGGEVVGCGFLIELAFLSGRARLAPYDAHALLTYES